MKYLSVLTSRLIHAHFLEQIQNGRQCSEKILEYLMGQHYVSVGYKWKARRPELSTGNITSISKTDGI